VLRLPRRAGRGAHQAGDLGLLDAVDLADRVAGEDLVQDGDLEDAADDRAELAPGVGA
jgi:hypothetical protein